MAPVVQDLRATGGPLPWLEESDWQDSVEGAESAFLRSRDGSGMGVWVDTRVPDAEQVVMVADQVQEWVVEELAANGRSTNWPRCPQHPRNHPLAAKSHEGRAVWRCPRGGTVVSEIGRLEGEGSAG